MTPDHCPSSYLTSSSVAWSSFDISKLSRRLFFDKKLFAPVAPNQGALLYGRIMKKVAISQSNYIPWKGYFDMIAAVDEFILYDDMQYTRRDWRNRNLIKTPQGMQWLTVPVKVKGKYLQSIFETEIDGDKWRQMH